MHQQQLSIYCKPPWQQLMGCEMRQFWHEYKQYKRRFCNSPELSKHDDLAAADAPWQRVHDASYLASVEKGRQQQRAQAGRHGGVAQTDETEVADLWEEAVVGRWARGRSAQ